MSEHVIFLHRFPTKEEIEAGALNVHLEEQTLFDSTIHKIHDVEIFRKYITFKAGEHTIIVKLRSVDDGES